MEELIQLLEEIQPGVDFANSTSLIDDGELSSFDVVSIVGELEAEYDIRFRPMDIIPQNFNSAKALYELICRLKEA